MTPTVRSLPHFRVSPSVLGPLGIEQLQDPALAVLELIKNAWDADARHVKVSVDQRKSPARISVSDDGHGMDSNEFLDRWLVIGRSVKRGKERSEGDRPLIGEKGLGRLASFALGDKIAISSAREVGSGFAANVDWGKLISSPSLEDYPIKVTALSRPRGTTVLIEDLKREWSASNTSFLASHAEFLASVPGEKFHIELRVDGKKQSIENELGLIDRLAEATLEMRVLTDGSPEVTSCSVGGVDRSLTLFREMKPEERDQRLAGMKLSLRFFRRDNAQHRLMDALQANEVTSLLERYQGVRVFRDGINVPPYGLRSDDWASLEKQRTSTGGPTLTPGNSQLAGELHLTKRAHPHLTITAGRSGFADQSDVASLARYVRWAVRALATARRAQHLRLDLPRTQIPSRVDEASSSHGRKSSLDFREAFSAIAKDTSIRSNPALQQQFKEARDAVLESLGESEKTLRLYAQLASTGIAATSFAHELRGEFDIVSEALAQVSASKKRLDKELIELLNISWNRIRAFAGLFKVIPVKIRRRRRIVSTTELLVSANAILELATADKFQVGLSVPELELNVVPAELDSILLNLVSNSMKAVTESDNRERGRIHIVFEAIGADLSVRVLDNGCGITKRVRQVMFEPLEGHFAEGTGMGLPIVKYIAERYDGSVAAIDSTDEDFRTEIVVILKEIVR